MQFSYLVNSITSPVTLTEFLDEKAVLRTTSSRVTLKYEFISIQYRR